MPISKINGVNINWRVIGDRGPSDRNPRVVMTTGGRRGHDEFVSLAEKIARYGYRVILHDRRNTGASDILIEGEEGEEVIWTRDMYALLS
jgi:pimeloyl-ACP methyl ester carboxylesterase